MIYRYDKVQLNFYKLNIFKTICILICVISIVSFTSFNVGTHFVKTSNASNIIEYTEMEKIVLIREADTFTKEKLILMLNDLNVKYPDIVLAQSTVETGKWRSKIFLENNNLFGMKEAKMRITTAEGTQYNHAYYNHWRESVYDYAFYQSRYLSKIRSKNEYFQYLSTSYAEDPNYINTIKNVIEKEKIAIRN